jgi:hypothetical protein
MKRTALLLAALAAALPAAAGPSNLNAGNSYAWAANIGWMDLIPKRPNPLDGVIVTDTHLSGFAWSDSTGWINFGDGTPANAIRYSNSTGTDSGVNHDGTGNFSGLAWSANLGWINFGWATPTDANRPRFDLVTGAFTGLAWSSNAGWINLDTGLLKTDSMCVPDSDADGISDAWELLRTSLANGGESIPTLTVLTATGDTDADGVSDKDEYYADTNPLEPGDLLTLLSMSPSANGSLLTWTSRPTRLYQIGQSDDLTNWTMGSLLAPDAGLQTSREASYSKSLRRFFRVDAVLPLRK